MNPTPRKGSPLQNTFLGVDVHRFETLKLDGMNCRCQNGVQIQNEWKYLPTAVGVVTYIKPSPLSKLGDSEPDPFVHSWR